MLFADFVHDPSVAPDSAAAADEWPRTSSASFGTVQRSSNTASARSAVTPAGPDTATASTVTDDAPASAGAFRLCFDRNSERSTLAAGRAEVWSRRATTTPAIIAVGQAVGVDKASDARNFSSSRRAGRWALEANWSSAARNASARLKDAAEEGFRPERFALAPVPPACGDGAGAEISTGRNSRKWTRRNREGIRIQCATTDWRS